MVNNMVGFLAVGISFKHLCEECVKGRMNMIKVRFMGDNMVLLTPRDGESMEDLLS